MSTTVCGQRYKYEKSVTESSSDNILFSITGMMCNKMLSDRDYGTLFSYFYLCIIKWLTLILGLWNKILVR